MTKEVSKEVRKQGEALIAAKNPLNQTALAAVDHISLYRPLPKMLDSITERPGQKRAARANRFTVWLHQNTPDVLRFIMSATFSKGKKAEAVCWSPGNHLDEQYIMLLIRRAWLASALGKTRGSINIVFLDMKSDSRGKYPTGMYEEAALLNAAYRAACYADAQLIPGVTIGRSPGSTANPHG